MNKWTDIWDVLKWVLLFGYIIVMMGFVKREHKANTCPSVNYVIDDEHAFVDTNDVYNMLMHDSLYPKGNLIQNINLKNIENAVNDHPAIKYTEVFSQLDGSVHIQIKQRNPVMRVITETNMHYYVDDELSLMNTDYDYTADVPVLSGNLPDTLLMAFRQDNDTLLYDGYPFTMNNVIDFAGYLYEHDMWRNMIVQIYINEDHEFELVPRIGQHIIILGSLDDYAYKMKKLEAIYKKAFADFGWKKYQIINLKYGNQVVCSKKYKRL